jgi:hypothetical protein
MLYSAKDVRKCKIMAQDGELGGVHDLFFDDRDYGIRYVVVDTGSWLPGKRVLIPREALGTPDWGVTELGVNLTREQIESQPGVESVPPLAVQARMRSYRGFVWTGYPWGGFVGSVPVTPAPAPPAAAETHVRSVHEITGYRIEARDGSIGHVEDFLFDDATWTLRDLVVDTRNWLPGKKVVIPLTAIGRMAWPEHTVHVALTTEEIQRARPLEDVSMLLHG